ncbi:MULTISPECIES: hypothetical protein [unclassified Aureimonas]|uniref:hypothetical protein n=1 Tax=unclassified Aureimonas TaxID=2615206 RepID=UPI0012E3E7F7|nr:MULTISPECIES: hypothetical protein [unclassified Aureimonas]
MRLAQADFSIPAPQGAARAAPAPSSAPAAPPASVQPQATQPEARTEVGTALPPFLLPRDVSTNALVAGGVVFVLLLGVFFAVKLSVTRGLQARYAAPGPASEAGWLLFAFLAFTSLVLIAAFIGTLWTRFVLIGPAGVVSLLLLVLFLRKRSVALKTRR